MTTTFQVTFDSRDPHVLAAWWADVLGWQVEPQDEAFIQKMVDEGHATADQTERRDGALVWRAGSAINPPEGTVAPRVLFQLADEVTPGKNRVHLDLRPGEPDDRDALLARLAAAGATELWRASQGPHAWITFADPEGNELCV